MTALRIASPSPRLDKEWRTEDSAPTCVRRSASRCGGRDENRLRDDSVECASVFANCTNVRVNVGDTDDEHWQHDKLVTIPRDVFRVSHLS